MLSIKRRNDFDVLMFYTVFSVESLTNFIRSIKISSGVIYKKIYGFQSQ